MKLLKKTILFTLALGSNIDLSSKRPFEFSYDLLYQLVPFAPVSIRGAVMGLREESFVSVYQRQSTTHIAITSIGREALRSMFPGLRTEHLRRDHVWTICLLLDVAKDTPLPARGMRTLLLRHGFFPLERGMYVLPKTVTSDLTQDIARAQKLNRIVVFESRRFIIGDEEQIISSIFPITKIAALRQTILKTLDTIGKKGRERAVLHPQTKASFLLLLPKLMNYFSHDLSIPDLYFPQDILLSTTKEQLFQVSAEILPKLLLQ